MVLVIWFSCNRKDLWQFWPKNYWFSGQETSISGREGKNFLCPHHQWLEPVLRWPKSHASGKSQSCPSLLSAGAWEGLLLPNWGPRPAAPAHLLEMQILRPHLRSETVSTWPLRDCEECWSLKTTEPLSLVFSVMCVLLRRKAWNRNL